jgi:hypothetical protein
MSKTIYSKEHKYIVEQLKRPVKRPIYLKVRLLNF